jgi:hypothetical protein
MAITNTEVNGTVDVLTVPAGKSYAVTSILITNIGAEDPTGAEANRSMIVNNALLPGAETFTLDSEKIVLGAGDFIRVAQSGANNISVVVSYLEV